MIFVDLHSPKPLYEQIKESIRTQLLRGVLRADDRLPSVRELAQKAAINPNTIQKAYRDLEAEGLIYTLPGRGCFAAGLGPDFKERRVEEIRREVQPMLWELRFLGVQGQEVVAWMKGGSEV